jgi:hypothetical protein
MADEVASMTNEVASITYYSVNAAERSEDVEERPRFKSIRSSIYLRLLRERSCPIAALLARRRAHRPQTAVSP